MSGFNTKVRNKYGEYEITFYTENRQDFEKVQDLCRELIDHTKCCGVSYLHHDSITKSDT